MMKGNTEIAIVAIAVVALFIFATGFQMPDLSGYLPAGSVLGIGSDSPSSPAAPYTPPSAAPVQSISSIFHAAIDPVAPYFLDDREADCMAYGGTWYDASDRMGCFSMTPGAFDSSSCLIPPMSNIALQCNAISGAVWQCDSRNAGCYYV